MNNAAAVVEALSSRTGEFTRTPKYGVTQRAGPWVGTRYRQAAVYQPLVEIGFGAYFTLAILYAVAHGVFGPIPFLALFQCGFFYAGFMSMSQQHAVPTASAGWASGEAN